MQFVEHLVKKIRETGDKYNSDVQIAPACILWPDKTRQWEGVSQILLKELPEFVLLGDYYPEKRMGPAIWLRSVISGKIDDFILSNDMKPIIYLPGVSRQDLRAVESCPEHLKPIVELQFRGAIWSQANKKDWTILAFLGSHQGGLGLDTARDNKTKDAMLRALEPLLYLEIEPLKGKKLDTDFFNTLFDSDYIRQILQWLDQEDDFRSNLSENEWQAFIEICKSKLNFNPEKDGILTGAYNLVSQDSTWIPVWDRYCEAPKRYPNIPDRIRGCSPPRDMAWWNPRNKDFRKWPQWNEDQEKNLQEQMEILENLPPHEARIKIIELENDHGARRKLLWAELGEAPLVMAMEPLAILSKITQRPLAAGSIDDMSKGYRNSGWQADNAVLETLTRIEKQDDIDLIQTVIQRVYKPWAEKSARYLQRIVYESGYPGGDINITQTPTYEEGECLLFVDGLRFDAAKRLVMILEECGHQITEKLTWAALPSVTATGKPAVSPIREKIYGSETTTDFEPSVAKSKQSLKSGHQFKKMLTESGWEILDPSSVGNVKKKAWCEIGDIDHEGHDKGWKIALHLDDILGKVQDRVNNLLQAGWKKIRIVTDHGWLLLPGNLPKIELPSAQTDTKWGRCATLKLGAPTKARRYPWFWNPDLYFALADGISCFRNGMEYAHGGVSLQECLTLELIVSPGIPPVSRIAPEITDMVWKGLRCTVKVDGVFESLSLDIRTQPGDLASSVVLAVNQLRKNGTASVIVENEDLEGIAATIVIINQKNELVTQINTIIGRGMK